MANRKETTEKSLREQMRELFVRNSARSNGQALQTQQPNPSQPAPPGARTQVNESRRGIWQRLYRRERRIQDIKSVGATTSAPTSATTSATTPATTSAATDVEPSNQQECLICGDDFPLSSLESLRCGHYFCDNCLIRSFRFSLDDNSLFPPSCCHQDIPLSPRVTRTLPADLFKLFLEKKNDVNAKEPQQKRTYCHVPRCSAWIRPENIIDNIAPCPECEAFTCANCKEEYHDNGMCTKKGGLQVPEVDDLGEKEGWKRCPSCGQMIQRTAGCSVIGR